MGRGLRSCQKRRVKFDLPDAAHTQGLCEPVLCSAKNQIEQQHTRRNRGVRKVAGEGRMIGREAEGDAMLEARHVGPGTLSRRASDPIASGATLRMRRRKSMTFV